MISETHYQFQELIWAIHPIASEQELCLELRDNSGNFFLYHCEQSWKLALPTLAQYAGTLLRVERDIIWMKFSALEALHRVGFLACYSIPNLELVESVHESVAVLDKLNWLQGQTPNYIYAERTENFHRLTLPPFHIVLDKEMRLQIGEGSEILIDENLQFDDERFHPEHDYLIGLTPNRMLVLSSKSTCSIFEMEK